MLWLLCALLSTALSVEVARAQWTIDFTFDQQQAEEKLGPTRVMPMSDALTRVKTRLESILSGSTGNVQITVSWSDPINPIAIAESTSSHFHQPA